MPQVCKECIGVHFEQNKAKIMSKARNNTKRKEKERTAKKKEALMTLSDWHKRAQKYFNRYIRERDIKYHGGVCIACGEIRKHNDAGHFYSVGSHPELRYNELNCHLECVACNQHKGGNLLLYAENLPKRIGQDKFEELQSLRNKPKQYTIPEIKELIEIYKQKIKELK